MCMVCSVCFRCCWLNGMWWLLFFLVIYRVVLVVGRVGFGSV